MKGGHLLGGIAIGAIIGLGVGYFLGVDTEKKNQWLKMLSDKVLGGCCDEEGCSCGEPLKHESPTGE